MPREQIAADHLLDLTDACCQELAAVTMQAATTRGVAHLALPGDPAFTRLYTTLVLDPRWRVLPWERVHVWLAGGDAATLVEDLLEHVPVPEAHRHTGPVGEDAARLLGASPRVDAWLEDCDAAGTAVTPAFAAETALAWCAGGSTREPAVPAERVVRFVVDDTGPTLIDLVDP